MYNLKPHFLLAKGYVLLQQWPSWDSCLHSVTFPQGLDVFSTRQTFISFKDKGKRLLEFKQIYSIYVQNGIVLSGRGNTDSYPFTVCNVAFSVNGEKDFRIDLLCFSHVSVVECVSDHCGFSLHQSPDKTKVPF